MCLFSYCWWKPGKKSVMSFVKYFSILLCISNTLPVIVGVHLFQDSNDFHNGSSVTESSTTITPDVKLNNDGNHAVGPGIASTQGIFSDQMEEPGSTEGMPSTSVISSSQTGASEFMEGTASITEMFLDKMEEEFEPFEGSTSTSLAGNGKTEGSKHDEGTATSVPSVLGKQTQKSEVLSSFSEDTTSFYWLSNDSTSNESHISKNAAMESITTHPWERCPDLGAKQVPDSVIKCHCRGNEILVDGKCQVYPNEMFIDVEDYPRTLKVNVSNYKVIIRNVTCDPRKTRSLHFERGYFHVRAWRGDVILLENSDHLQGLRINNYCIIHHLDDESHLTWTMKGCIPIPSVPRCCPQGMAMKDGSCQPANTPQSLKPLISADPYATKAVDWPDINNFLNPLTCTDEPVKTIPSMYKDSFLVSLPRGLEHSWIPGDIDNKRVYHSCPDFCVDGIVNQDGSVSYFTSFCYAPPKQRHLQICSDKSCLRKCCPEGEIYENNTFMCLPQLESPFIPNTSRDLSQYNIVTGMPFCEVQDLINEPFSIDDNGFMETKNSIYPSTDYCVDTFSHDEIFEMGALACHIESSYWNEVKLTLVPVCYGISLFFLVIIIIFHLVVPQVQENGGLYQLCHAVALSVAYIASFTDYVFHNFIISNASCFVVASLMQFGFLATFFWLNVMCFEIWQKIRSLRRMLPSQPFGSWYYMLYSWGSPIVICTVTLSMQHLVPEDITGVIRPDIGISRCFLNEDGPFFAYYYGPISVLLLSNLVFLVLTQINLFMLLQEYKKITNALKSMGTGVLTTAPQATSSMPSRHRDHIYEYKQRLYLFMLMAVCWVTEVLSWKIPPLELWAATDTINALQGFFVFIIFLLNNNKWQLIRKKFPHAYKAFCQVLRSPMKLRRLLRGGDSSSTLFANVGSLCLSADIKRSISTLVTSLTSPFKSSSSVNLSDPSESNKRSVSLDEKWNGGIVALTHGPLRYPKSESSVPIRMS